MENLGNDSASCFMRCKDGRPRRLYQSSCFEVRLILEWLKLRLMTYLWLDNKDHYAIHQTNHFFFFCEMLSCSFCFILSYSSCEICVRVESYANGNIYFSYGCFYYNGCIVIFSLVCLKYCYQNCYFENSLS